MRLGTMECFCALTYLAEKKELTPEEQRARELIIKQTTDHGQLIVMDVVRRIRSEDEHNSKRRVAT